MIFKIPTYHKELSLEVVLTATSKPVDLFVVGFDSSKKHTEYFKRKIYLKGKDTYLFKLPKSPSELTLLIYDMGAGFNVNPSSFIVNSIKILPLKKSTIFADQLTRDFYDFASEFCEKCGSLSVGDYYDNKRQFKIQYFDKILSEAGKEMNTPARISISDNTIQVSKSMMDTYTIPIRLAVLGHEYAHNYLNSNDASEIEADYNSLKIYLCYGYPYIEAIYTYTNVLSDNRDNENRINYILRLVEKYQFETEDKNHGLVFNNGIIY